MIPQKLNVVIDLSNTVQTMDEGLYLFTTKTCPNCSIAKAVLADLNYTVIDAEEQPEITTQLGIMQAPTLVVVADGEIKKYVNVSNIRRFLEECCVLQ